MPEDLLWRNLKELPAFRGLLRAVEARFYQSLELAEPVLDLGCGDAHFASVAFERPLQAGVDPWWASLREAPGRRAYQILVQAEGATLPFPTGHFACAVSNSVLEHIPHLDPVLTEVGRVLQPGAPFYLCAPSDHFLAYLSISGGLRRLGLLGAAGTYERWFNRISRHHHIDSPETWKTRLGQAGFSMERWWYYFSPGALRALEWGHYLGLPSAVAKLLFGRWVLVPARWNLALTEGLLRKFYDEPPPREGAYLFMVARKATGLTE